jgi:sugar O-acyltransferase (sialic acid O-acetyltransferase NeuD family)
MNPENPRPALLIFGAGGHGRVVADAALRSGHWSAVSASDRDGLKCQGYLSPGVPMMLPEQVPSNWAVHMAIGNNEGREREAACWGVKRLVNVIHPAASVSGEARLGQGCFVAAMAVIAPGALVGTGVIVNHGAIVDHDVVVGDFTHVAPHVTLGGSVKLGKNILLGAGCTVLPGLTVTDGVVIGAGAVVCRHIEQAGTYIGVPARRIA